MTARPSSETYILQLASTATPNGMSKPLATVRMDPAASTCLSSWLKASMSARPPQGSTATAVGAPNRAVPAAASEATDTPRTPALTQACVAQAPWMTGPAEVNEGRLLGTV